MKYDSRKTVPSKLDADVSYVLRRINQYKRDRIEDLRRPFEERLRPLRDEIAPLREELDASIKRAYAHRKDERAALQAAGKTEAEALKEVPIGVVDMPDDRFKRYLELSAQIQRIDREEITPLVVSYVLISITGLEILGDDGKPLEATAENLRQFGSDEMYAELTSAVASELGLTEEETKNSESPSTSAAVDGEASPSGNAASAGTTETITGAAA